MQYKKDDNDDADDVERKKLNPLLAQKFFNIFFIFMTNHNLVHFKENKTQSSIKFHIVCLKFDRFI